MSVESGSATKSPRQRANAPGPSPGTEVLMHAESTALHPTAVKVLQAIVVCEERSTNHLEWIAEEAGVSDSTASRWIRRLDDLELVISYKQDWIWGDPHKYWRTTWRGDEAVAAASSRSEAS